MARSDALALINAEIKSGATFPVEYKIPVQGNPNSFYTVIVYAPAQTTKIAAMRKRAMESGTGTLNFAPVGGCPTCGR